MTQKEELVRLREENEKLRQQLSQVQPEAPESEQLSEDTWSYPSLGIRVTAASKEDADRKALKFLPIHEEHLKERAELEKKDRTEEEDLRLAKLKKLG